MSAPCTVTIPAVECCDTTLTALQTQSIPEIACPDQTVILSSLPELDIAPLVPPAFTPSNYPCNK